jgi:hypothetical protein
LSGKPATFSWQELLQGQPPPAKQLRRLIGVQPTLDFASIAPFYANNLSPTSQLFNRIDNHGSRFSRRIIATYQF